MQHWQVAYSQMDTGTIWNILRMEHQIQKVKKEEVKQNDFF